RIDEDHVLQVLQAVADLSDLARLGGVLADDHPSLRVTRHPLALLGRVRRVDWHHDAPGAGDREAREGPLRARVREDGGPVIRLEPERDESERELVHELADLGEGALPPLAVIAVPHRDTIAV